MAHAFNKTMLVEQIVAQLADDVEAYARSARTAQAEATDEQSQPEHKYDTRGLEAAYLAGGQARKVAEVEEAIAQFQKLKVIEFGPDALVDYGALVQVDMRGGVSWYFIGPKAGGLEIVQDKDEVTIITPQSPLGEQLMEKKQGDKFKFGAGRDSTEGKILAVL